MKSLRKRINIMLVNNEKDYAAIIHCYAVIKIILLFMK